MLRIFGKSQLPANLKPPVVTLGTFDGVHLGHQEIIRQTIGWARSFGGPAVILTFDQHPRAVLSGMPSAMLHSLDHRLILFERLGIDACVILEFNLDLASVTAEQFVEDYLVAWLGIAGILIGYDCRFGKGARGNVDLLQAMAARLGFEVRACEQVQIGHLVPSSTAIRQAIVSGKLEQASSMLGRAFSILGQVVPGDARGRQLGFPTANVAAPRQVLPPRGVYACRIEFEGNNFPSVTNIGVRPTIREEGELTIETHLLDFQGDLYGKTVEVQFLRFLRGERKFSSLEELKAQIARDIQETRMTLGN